MTGQISARHEQPNVASQVDYNALAFALVQAMQQAGVIQSVTVASAYEQIRLERVSQPNDKPISARDLAKRANIRRSTCSEWLQKQGVACQEDDILEGTE